MSFTTSKLTDLEVVNKLLTEATLEKGNIENKLANLAYARTQMDLQEQNTLVQIQGLQGELDAVNQVLPTLPEGETKLEMQNGVTRLQYRIFQANNRLKRYGGQAMVANERAQAKQTHLKTEVDAYLAALQTRKTELEG